MSEASAADSVRVETTEDSPVVRTVAVEVPKARVSAAFEKAYTARGGHVELNWFPGMPHRFGKLEGPESEDARHRMVEFAAHQIAAFAS